MPSNKNDTTIITIILHSNSKGHTYIFFTNKYAQERKWHTYIFFTNKFAQEHKMAHQYFLH